jgi:hypothetical protein
MKELLYIVIYPFIFATGCGPKSMLAENPKYGLWYANFMFLVLGYFHWLLTANNKFSVMFMLLTNWLLVRFIVSAQWQVAILLAWAATDFIQIITNFYYAPFDWALVLIYIYRDIYEKKD